MTRVLVDTDVILDVALARQPFLEASKNLLGLFENNAASGFVVSNGIANVYYILRKAGGDKKARKFIETILVFLTVIPIDHSMVLEALKSGFKDFEDALQYHSANRNRCEAIVTRNIEDYKKSGLNVYLPAEFLHFYAKG